ncbi:MAG: hypothetical protein D6771_07935 [Zetaproteobacteria bacterium]|nr:MAG: hypothetical protein D6771_07935 [Zetaproteobacteria bacterium]
MRARAWVVAAALFAAARASAAGLADAAAQAAQHAPELAAQRLALKQAEIRERLVEETLASRLQGFARAGEDRPPTTSIFQPTRTQSLSAGASWHKPLASGAELDISAQITRTQWRYDSPFAAQLATLNPAWRGELAATLRLPLAAGRGRPDLMDARAQALEQQAQAEEALARAAREAALAAIQEAANYLRLQAEARAAGAAVARARRLVADARRRWSLGLIEKDRVDEALAQLHEAEARRARAATSLNRLVESLRRRTGWRDREIQALRPEPVPIPDTLEALTGYALAHRPEIVALRKRLEAAELRVQAARKRAGVRADLVFDAGLRSLAGQGGRALVNMPSTHYPRASIGIELQEGLGRADELRVAAAQTAREAVRAAIDAFEETLRRELAGLWAERAPTEARLRAARSALRAARAMLAQRKRQYAAARVPLAQLLAAEARVAEAEKAVRQAEADRAELSALIAWSAALVPKLEER